MLHIVYCMGNQQNFTQDPTEVVKANVNELMVGRCARVCLARMNLVVFKHIEFWHTWANMEAVAFMVQHPLITKQVKDKAREIALKQWSNFQPTDSTPCYYKDRAIGSNKKFWDSDNQSCLWDDRLWLGCSYLMLYAQFQIKKYKVVADGLLNLILDMNQNPREGMDRYDGLYWKGKVGYKNTVTNILLMVFTGRFLLLDQDSVMLDMLKRQYEIIFCKNRFIDNNEHNILSDGPDPGGYWTYNQAMVLEGLAYLAVFDSAESQKYIKQISRITNGFMKYFKSPVTDKLILVEGDYLKPEDSRNNQSVFRSYLFRHLCTAKRVLNLKAGLWQAYISQVPMLRICLLDNFQAMCKFQSTNPGWRWDLDKSSVDYWNPFNMFFVYCAGYELFSIIEMTVPGVWFRCNGKIQISANKDIKQINLLTYKPNTDIGRYFNDRVFRLYRGINNIDQLIMEKFCVPENNRNILGLDIIYNDDVKVSHMLVHIEMNGSKFGLMPNINAEEIINNCGVRIRVGEENSVTYQCSASKDKIRVGGPQGGPLFIEML